jgi:hypothetical protein
MRAAILAFAVTLAACGQSEPPPPPEPQQTVTAPPAPWFICDAIDAPVLLVFEREGAVAHVAQYDKPNGALIQRTDYAIGVEDAGMGSIYTTLMQNGAEAGTIRQINPGMLETPASAYTTPFSSVRLGEREITCRWLPRTRLMGFTGRRTIVVHEDQDGDLIYTSYDFATAAQAQQIELSENARTTSFSLEVRDGEEVVTPAGARYDFRADVETDIFVSAPRDRSGTVEVRRHGPNPVQTENLTAFVEGQGPTN